jgi:hypothetical protein
MQNRLLNKICLHELPEKLKHLTAKNDCNLTNQLSLSVLLDGKNALHVMGNVLAGICFWIRKVN